MVEGVPTGGSAAKASTPPFRYSARMTRAPNLPDAPLPDAAAGNWVDRHAPAGLRPWLKLGRFDRPAGIWLLMLPGWMGIALAGAMQQRWPDPVLMVLFLAGAALMRAAGCAYNDIVDRDIDARVARTALRPIPAGQISLKQAWAFVLGSCGLGFLILLTLNVWAVGLGIASTALVAAYPFMKRITWWPQAWLGLTFNWGAPMGFAAALGGASLIPLGTPAPFVALSPWPAVLLYGALIFWTLGYDTIYAVQDLEDDALAGVKSSARRLGDNAPRGVLVFYGLCFVLVLMAGSLGGLGPLALLPLGLFGLHLSRQAARLRLDDPALALRLFKSNTLAGLLLVAALVAGLWRPAGF
jgi:4-hydroxybenzoate polyprenyltransferase